MKRLTMAATALCLAIAGCRSGTTVRIEQRSVAGITTMEFSEWTLPIVSISSGPSFSLWQSRDTPSKIVLDGFCATTNSTDALAIYSSREQKCMKFNGTFEVSSTNNVQSSSNTTAGK